VAKAGVASLQWTVASLSTRALHGAGAGMKKGAMVPVLAAGGKAYLVAAIIGSAVTAAIGGSGLHLRDS